MVRESRDHHDFRYLVLSALSLRLRAPTFPLCLFTDAAPAAVDAAAAALGAPEVEVGGPLFDVVLRDGGAAFVGRNAGERAMLDPFAPGVTRHRAFEIGKLRSRLGRIMNLGRAPFELTLFVDDDTFFCAPASELAAALGDLHRRRAAYAVRARVMPKADRERRVVDEALRCAWSHARQGRSYGADLELKCVDRAAGGRPFCSGAQGGALAIARSPAGAAFARDWLDAYARFYSREAKLAPEKLSPHDVDSYGADQAPLARLMAGHCRSPKNASSSWAVGALPHAFNVRAVEGATNAARCASPIFGPLLVLHQKRYVAGGNVSEALARLTGLCADLHRPGRALPWLGPAPKKERRPPCDWMAQHRGGRR